MKGYHGKNTWATWANDGRLGGMASVEGHPGGSPPVTSVYIFFVIMDYLELLLCVCDMLVRF